jgi:hypothetical protein
MARKTGEQQHQMQTCKDAIMMAVLVCKPFRNLARIGFLMPNSRVQCQQHDVGNEVPADHEKRRKHDSPDHQIEITGQRRLQNATAPSPATRKRPPP